MPIEFRCPSCHRLLRTPDDTAGKQARCPECGAIASVPDSGMMPPMPPPPSGSSGQAAVGPSDPFKETQGPSEGGPSSLPPPPGGSRASENPYASPTAETPAGMFPPIAHPDLRNYASSRVFPPAVGLVIVGGITLAVQGLVLLAAIADLGLNLPRNMAPALLAGGFLFLVPGIGIILNILVVLGGMKMMRLESYGTAMAACVIAMLPTPCGCTVNPCCTPLWLFGFIFGVWGLVALSDHYVRSAFAG